MKQKFLKKHVNLTLDEQYELIRLYKEKNDISARDKIVQANYKLIFKLTKSFSYNYDENYFDDLLSEALKCAYECLKNFQLNRGKCSVVSWIRTSVVRALNEYSQNNNIISVNLSARKKHKIEEELSNEYFLKNGVFPQTGDVLTYNSKNGTELFTITGKNIKHEYIDIDTFNDLNDVDEPSYPDSFEGNVNLNKLNSILKYTFFTERELIMLDWVYYKSKSPANLKYILPPMNEEEERNIYKSGLNQVIIGDNKYNFYLFMNKYNKIKYSSNKIDILDIEDNIFLKKETLFITSNEKINISYNNTDIEPIYENGIYIYEIKLLNKGAIYTSQTMYNMHEAFLDKLRFEIIKK